MRGFRTPTRPAPPAEPRQRGLAHVIGGSSFIFLCRIGGAALAFASQVLLARWMGASEFGVYVIAFSWCILLSTLATGGMAQGAMRFVGSGLARDDWPYVRGYVRRGVQVAAVGGVGMGAVGALLLLVAGDMVPDGWRLPLLVTAATLPFSAVLSLYSGTANAFPWLMQSFLPVNVFRPLLFLLALVALARWQQQYTATQAMMLQWACFVVVAVLASVAFHVRLGREVPGGQRAYDTRHWLRTAVPLLGASTFSAYLPEITVVLSGFFLPSSDVGVLQVSYRIALVIGFGLYAVDSYTAPEAARLVARTDQANLQKTITRATRLRFWPSLAAVLVLALAGRPILAIFGPEFVTGYAVLVILAVAQLIQAAVGPVTRLMMLGGYQDRSLLAALGSLALLVPLLAVLAPRYGAEGAAVAALIDIAVWSVWMRYLVVQSLGIRPSII